MSCVKLCCQACCNACCYCLKKEKKEYPHIQYSSLQERESPEERCSSEQSVFSAPPQSSGNLETWQLSQDVFGGMEQCRLPPAKIFSFPQARSEYTPHPQFSKSDEDVIIDQPKGRRFSTETSISSLSEYSAVVRMPRGGSLPRGFSMPQRANIPRSESLPVSGSLARSVSPVTPPRKASIPSTSEVEWMPSLPVLKEHSLENDNQPSLQFSLHYDIQRSMLSVHLHHASNLPAMDKRGTSDPFVVMFLVPNREEIFESSIVAKTLNPTFDQSFDFRKLTPDDIRRQTLVFRIYDHDKFSKNDIIGGVALPLKTVDLFGVVMRMRIEKELDVFKDGDSKGDLLVALTYNPRLGSLKGVVLKATNLKKQDIVGLADPYVKVNFIVKGRRKNKWKSSVKRNTLVPVFNESFEFNMSNIDPQEVLLELYVMDYDRFSRNDAMGVVLIGSNVVQESGVKHWTSVTESPQQSISNWHSILPVSQCKQNS